MHIIREIDQVLLNWKNQAKRKPLMLRGARQVGKSTAVQYLSKNFEHYIEINFEEQKEIHSFFAGDLSPKEICENISIYFNTPITAGKTLLFFDEIQACLPAISSLRFFYEKYSEIHLISSGSLIEFALEELPSFGVGRIRSVFLNPLSFDEFLVGLGETKLMSLKNIASADKPLPEALHNKLISYLKKFLITGGMPEAVKTYIETNDLLKVQNVLEDLLISIIADFAKYKRKVPSLRINEVFQAVIQQTGGKFIFSKAATQANLVQIKEALRLLVMSGLIIPVTHSSANGIPLGAETDERKRKYIVLDTGIFQRALGLDLSAILTTSDFDSINKGAIAEMLFGLEWLKYGSFFNKEDLFYWHRENKNANAEVDYVIQEKENVVPIEIKASNKGSMQSLFQFLKEKNSKKGYRISLENFSEFDQIKVFPLYAISTIRKENS